MKRLIIFLIILLLALAVVPMVVANRHDVVVHIAALSVDVSLPLYLVFFVGLLAGVVLMGVVASSSRVKARLHALKAEREVKQLAARLRGYEEAEKDHEQGA